MRRGNHNAALAKMEQEDLADAKREKEKQAFSRSVSRDVLWEKKVKNKQQRLLIIEFHQRLHVPQQSFNF